MTKLEFMMPQTSTVGLVLHYKMWDGKLTSTTVFDYSLNGNLGTAGGGVTAKYPGLQFSSGEINAGSDSTIDDIFGSGGTFAAWVKPESIGGGGQGAIYGKDGGGIAGTKLFTESSTTLEFVQIAAIANGQWRFAFDVDGNVWQHLVLTYTAGSDNLIAYVNGVSVNVTEIIARNGAAVSDAAEDLLIGTDGGGQVFDGTMDDLMFFNRTLRFDEARSLYEITRSRYGV